MQLRDRIIEHKEWKGIPIAEDLCYGDMPGDVSDIKEIKTYKAECIFQELLKLLPDYTENTDKIVLSVCGGSGVGKSITASLLTYYFNQIGIPSYTLSGDNYPHRIPKYNDAERLMVYREGGMKGLVQTGLLHEELLSVLRNLQEQGLDSNGSYAREFNWLHVYQDYAAEALASYLGTERELGFDELSDLIQQFKEGKESLYLRRMGRTDTELWYEEVSFADVKILIVEWTHGNSDYLSGVDIPILLNSTPEETLAYRKERNRDGAVDSPFTNLVLRIEQDQLIAQAKKAKLIVAQSGEIIDYSTYCEIMKR